MAVEDFSFPATGKTSLCGMDSPPLWHLSPAASPNCRRGGGNKEKEGFRGKSNMYEKEDRKQRIADDGEENKMDSLWEDFDEVLISNKTSSSTRDTVGLGCVHQSLAMSKAGGRLNTTSKNKAGLVLIAKVFKKLFLLHNSQLKLKKNGRDGFSSYG